MLTLGCVNTGAWAAHHPQPTNHYLCIDGDRSPLILLATVKAQALRGGPQPISWTLQASVCLLSPATSRHLPLKPSRAKNPSLPHALPQRVAPSATVGKDHGGKHHLLTPRHPHPKMPPSSTSSSIATNSIPCFPQVPPYERPGHLSTAPLPDPLLYYWPAKPLLAIIEA